MKKTCPVEAVPNEIFIDEKSIDYYFGAEDLIQANAFDEKTVLKAMLWKRAPHLFHRFPRFMFDDIEGLKLLKTQIMIHPETPQSLRVIRKWKKKARKIFKNFSLASDWSFQNPSNQEWVFFTPGDHVKRTEVYVEKSPFDHHSLYIGQGYLIDVMGENIRQDDEIKRIDIYRDIWRVFSDPFGDFRHMEKNLKGSHMYVRLIHMDDYVKEMKSETSTISIVENQPVSGPVTRARREAIHLAMCMIGSWNYSIFSANCETFVNYCLRNKTQSDQSIPIQEILNRARTAFLSPFRGLIQRIIPLTRVRSSSSSSEKEYLCFIEKDRIIAPNFWHGVFQSFIIDKTQIQIIHEELGIWIPTGAYLNSEQLKIIFQ